MFGFLDTWLNAGVWVGIVLIILGFIGLIKGADWLVDGASAIAKRFGISDLVIGLTVVAFGTSMPEFVVNMISVAHGSTDLAITNILGSNIINTFVILGLTAAIYPIATQERTRNFDIPMSILAGGIVVACIFLRPLITGQGKGIDYIGGIVLLIIFIYFLANTFLHAKHNPDDPGIEEVEIKQISPVKSILLILLGLAGLVIGGELIVKSAVNIAVRLGVSEAIIGLTIVALGTSLPELATSVIAAYKHNADIAVGNVFGSNIFNVFFVLGTSATVNPLPAYDGIELDACMAALGGIITWLVIKANHKRQVTRIGGILLLLVYSGYLTYRLMTV
ncbi:MAG: calcium/sodium antiporter [Paludibacteraceae bacterium]|nr:calcium/sodium antiporter [Paludibacteraceae bacterium]